MGEMWVRVTEEWLAHAEAHKRLVFGDIPPPVTRTPHRDCAHALGVCREVAAKADSSAEPACA